MKRVWFDNVYQTSGKLAEEVQAVLGRSDFNVELFGVSKYSDSLPSDYSIVDHGSRDLLAYCEDGKVTTNPLDLEVIEYKDIYLYETYDDPDGEWQVTNIKAMNGKIFAEIKNVQDGNINEGFESIVPIEEVDYFMKR